MSAPAGTYNITCDEGATFTRTLTWNVEHDYSDFDSWCAAHPMAIQHPAQHDDPEDPVRSIMFEAGWGLVDGPDTETRLFPTRQEAQAWVEDSIGEDPQLQGWVRPGEEQP